MRNFLMLAGAGMALYALYRAFARPAIAQRQPTIFDKPIAQEELETSDWLQQQSTEQGRAWCPFEGQALTKGADGIYRCQ